MTKPTLENWREEIDKLNPEPRALSYDDGSHAIEWEARNERIKRVVTSLLLQLLERVKLDEAEIGIQFFVTGEPKRMLALIEGYNQAIRDLKVLKKKLKGKIK